MNVNIRRSHQQLLAFLNLTAFFNCAELFNCKDLNGIWLLESDGPLTFIP